MEEAIPGLIVVTVRIPGRNVAFIDQPHANARPVNLIDTRRQRGRRDVVIAPPEMATLTRTSVSASSMSARRRAKNARPTAAFSSSILGKTSSV